ncbi:MAG: hypothetical protein LUC43_03165, partial [Burkholderiales bacterium]|nr:hypothetical protein [Burkholderiales bacterium]
MRFSITLKAAGLFASAVATAFLLSSCRTIPSDPEQLTCDDLDYLAAESVKKNKYPFFVSQLTHPADWRVYSFTDSEVDWIKNDSRRRMRESKKDWGEVEALRLATASGTQ